MLRITGDQIPLLQAAAGELHPQQRIGRYYALLEEALAASAAAALADLRSLMSDYEVAFGAADTAEVNNVVSDIAERWATLRTLHARYYSPAAVADLESAYARLFPILDPTD